MKKILSLLLCLCLLFSAAALAEDTAAAELQDTDVLATVNGTELTWADVEPVYDSLVSSYGNYYDLTDSANVELFRAVAMQNKINEVIMQAKIAELGIALTDEEAADAENDAQTDWDNAISNYISQQHSELTDESSQEDKDAANAASGKPYQIEISIGCARLEPDIATVHDLIDKADQEMYHLKTRKRGTAPAEKQD